MISRLVLSNIEKRIGQKKAIVLTGGARQVGKATLINDLLAPFDDVLHLDGDDPYIRNQLKDADFQKIQDIIGNHKILFDDEAQRIDGLGLTAKMIVDRLPQV